MDITEAHKQLDLFEDIPGKYDRSAEMWKEMSGMTPEELKRHLFGDFDKEGEDDEV